MEATSGDRNNIFFGMNKVDFTSRGGKLYCTCYPTRGIQFLPPKEHFLGFSATSVIEARPSNLWPFVLMAQQQAVNYKYDVRTNSQSEGKHPPPRFGPTFWCDISVRHRCYSGGDSIRNSRITF